MSEFARGLQLSRLHPPHIITFLQGLPRRLDERLVEHATTGAGVAPEAAAARPAQSAAPEDSIDVIADTLSQSIDAVKAIGYALDDSIREFWSPAVDADPVVSRIAAAALELARRLSGVPDRAWTANPALLDRLRTNVAIVAEHLDAIGGDVAGQIEDDPYGDAVPGAEATEVSPTG